MKPSSASVLALSALLLAAAQAFGQDATAQAKVLFNAGAQAYEAGQFAAALQAFTEAYRLSPRPGILFSMAQAQRKQYYVDKQPARAREAVKLYREYVAKVEQGGRRGDAVQALAELEPIVERLGASEGAAAAQPPERKAVTQLMVSAIKEATVLLDGKPIEGSIFHVVKPGKHAVRVTAPGYFPEEREVPAAEGGTVALDISMREQPGLLSVTARDGSDVAIDGRIAATTPLGRPIEVTPGAHFVAVTRRGYKPFSQDLEISRGESKSLTAPLEVTGQRVVAITLVSVAAAGLVTGGTLAAVALAQQGKAQSLDTRRLTQGGLSAADLAQYNSYVSTRDTVRTAAGATLAGSLVVGITGVFLAVFDIPTVAGGRRDDRPKPAAPAPRDRPLEVSAVPILGPGLYGASLGARF